ncbi:protein FAM210A isoform X3 [Bombus affinis]|uniref:Protein FAM210A isoform X3 n=1 Tax=Bombus terrestris TaxID=30195 RepID=A0A9B2MP94_BOMTE|nr:protein FAM210A isoform X3 [Bombus terrestris]XP_050591348.1 protein FAM210A isoform X3 [Bombus affinis]
MDVSFCRGIRFATTLGFSPILVTKNFLETTRLTRYTDSRRWRLKFFERHPHYRNLSCNYVPFLNHIKTYEMPYRHKFVFAKMKQMTKDYWHILVPVHLVTSIGWILIFYVTIKNGVDISHLMELMHFSKKYIDKAKDSTVGNWALAYLLYKIFTPLRYTVTIGCTTMAIRQLSKAGLVKPLSFGKQSQMVYKTTESSKTTTMTPKTGFKIERQTEPPKT